LSVSSGGSAAAFDIRRQVHAFDSLRARQFPFEHPHRIRSWVRDRERTAGLPCPLKPGLGGPFDRVRAPAVIQENMPPSDGDTRFPGGRFGFRGGRRARVDEQQWRRPLREFPHDKGHR